MSEKLGILGVGHLASYVVTGLRNAGDGRSILLSPRNRERSLQLHQEQDCIVAASNQEVLDRCTLVLLAVRPEQVTTMLDGLAFRAEQLIISCVAGLPLENLMKAVVPAQVVRTLPLACSEVGEGAIPVYPDHPAAHQLLSQIGKLVAFDSEEQFELASTAACMNGWIYAFLDQLTDWFAEQGLSEAQARDLVIHSVRGATGLATAKPDLPLRGICDAIATEGTFTKLGLDLLKKGDAFAPWQGACQAVYRELKK